MCASSKPTSFSKVPEATVPTTWGERAARLYGADYARRYRQVDDEIRHGALVTRFAGWLGATCDRLGPDLVALDLGCGTGRYFWALRNVRELVGVDVSAAMLAEARQPVDAGAIAVDTVSLIEGDFLTVALPPRHFDLAYSIGVLGEHVPLDAAIVKRVHGWLNDRGRFAFTGVHRDSFSIPRTARRRMAESIADLGPARMQKALRQRLLAGGLYVDEDYIAALMSDNGFEVESLERHESDVHLHCLCVARKVAS
jgi:SAM-dependent methyltransferase